MRRSLAVLVALLLSPAAAEARSTSVFSKNTELVSEVRGAAGAIALEFSDDEPLMVASTLKGIHTFDITDPANPRQLGFLPMVIWQNEGMDLIERPGGERYALVASAGAVAGLRGTEPDTETGGTSGKKVFVVELTDPAAPRLISSIATPTRTHTVSCPDRRCNFAYSDGRAGGAMSIVDLRDPHQPKVAGTYASVVPGGHDQDADEAGVLWHVGVQGAVALDVSDARKPVQLNATNEQGLSSSDFGGKPWNNFILHNSYRPNAEAFDDGGARLDSGPPRLEDGNVLLVTEEDYANTGGGRCGDYEGSFQTWRVPWLDAGEFAARAPKNEPGKGTIEPIDRWNTELIDSGMTTPAGAFCSAHYFDYLEKGFVAQGWYQQGTRILDVRDPTDIKQVGYFFTGALETWGAHWVPRKWAKGQTLVYTADAQRGIDVLRVTLPAASPKKTKAVRAPILRSWLEPKRGLAFRASREWGLACPLLRRSL